MISHRLKFMAYHLFMCAKRKKVQKKQNCHICTKNGKCNCYICALQNKQSGVIIAL